MKRKRPRAQSHCSCGEQLLFICLAWYQFFYDHSTMFSMEQTYPFFPVNSVSFIQLFIYSHQIFYKMIVPKQVNKIELKIKLLSLSILQWCTLNRHAVLPSLCAICSWCWWCYSVSHILKFKSMLLIKIHVYKMKKAIPLERDREGLLLCVW